MAARKRDVAADGAAYQGDDRQQQDQRVIGLDAVQQGVLQRRIGLQHGVADHPQHHQAEELHQTVHHLLGVAQHEDGDDQYGGHQGADQGRNPEDHIDGQACAGDVADVEGDATEHDEGRDQVAHARQHAVGHVLATQVGDGDDPPDIQLGADVDQQGDDDGEGEAGQVLLGEQGGLGQEGGADGRGRHDEDGTAKDIPLVAGCIAGKGLGRLHGGYLLAVVLGVWAGSWCARLPGWHLFNRFVSCSRSRRSTPAGRRAGR